MPSLAEIRQQYPQYNDMSDQQLADALYSKFYADMPRAQFDARVGYQGVTGEGGGIPVSSGGGITIELPKPGAATQPPMAAPPPQPTAPQPSASMAAVAMPAPAPIAQPQSQAPMAAQPQPNGQSSGGFQPPSDERGLGTEAAILNKGFNEGLNQIVGGALDLVPDTISRLAGRGGYTPVEDAFARTFIAPAPQPTGPVERAVERGGNFVGQSVPFLGGVGAAANSGVRAIETAAPTIGNAARMALNSLIEAYAKHPVASMLSDAVSNAGAGAGNQVARENNLGPVGELAATVGGGLGTQIYKAYGPLGSGLKLAKAGVQKVVAPAVSRMIPESGPFVPQGLADYAAAKRAADAQNFVESELGPIMASPAVQQEQARVAALKEQIPGFNPTLAKQTNDPILLQRQAELESQAQGDELRALQARQGQSAQAIRDFADTVAPAPTATPYPEDIVGKAAAQRVGQANSAVNQQIAQTQNNIRQTAEGLPEADRSAIGSGLRDIRTAEQRAADQQVNALRAAIDPTNSVRVPTDDLNHAVMGSLAKLKTDLTSPNVPQSVRQLIDKTFPQTGLVGPTGEPLPHVSQTTDINSLLEKRTDLLQDLRRLSSAAVLSPDQISQRDVLRSVLGDVNDFIDGLKLPDPGMQQRFDAFRNFYKNEYVPRFLEGASRDIGRYDQTGYGKQFIANEDVPAQFFGPNNISGAKQFNKLYGNNPQARQLMTDYALDDLRQKAVDPQTGLLKPNAVAAWLNRNSRVLDELPFVRDAVQAKNPSALYKRLADLNARKAAIADSTVSRLLGSEPGVAIDKAMSDWRAARALKASVRGDPEAEQALTRAVWNRVLGAGDTGEALYDAGKIAAVLKNNARSLAQILSPEHLKSLQTIIDAATVEGRLPAPKGTVPQPQTVIDAAGKAIGMSVPTVLTTATTLARGRSSPIYEGSRLMINWYRNLSEKAARQAWREALYNPKVAEQVAAVAKAEKATKMQANRLQTYLLLSPFNTFNDQSGNAVQSNQ